MTLSAWMKDAVDALRGSGCPDPEIDARWMAEDLLGISTAGLHFEAQWTLEPDEVEKLNAALKRRISGEPVQYILRRADFMGLRFYVDERVLIPRPDTETLAGIAIVALQGRREVRVLDLCAGSGAIGLSIASLVPGASVTLTDVSSGAVDVCRRNAQELNLDVRVRKGDLFKAVDDERFDLIACNPPYIPSAELTTLQREVQYEPKLALDGGEDGLKFYRRIASEVTDYLLPGGELCMEVGAGQATDVMNLLKHHCPGTETGSARDLNGIERVVWMKV